MEQNFDSENFKGSITPNGFFFHMTKRDHVKQGICLDGLNVTMNLGFGVPPFEDVDREYERLIHKGLIPPTTTPWGHRDPYVVDPEGNIISIHAVSE